MKVGGNESATKFFRSNGGTAVLNSKDPKTKYTSPVATKYKEEIKRRAERDRDEYVYDEKKKKKKKKTPRETHKNLKAAQHAG